MSSILPRARRFDAPVYGTIFAARAAAVARLAVGHQLILVPDPAGVDHPSVWVHAPGGDVVGHFAPDINRWMVAEMLSGVRYSASVHTVAGTGTESWKKLVVSVQRLDA
ncbi:MAG: hypothetical protein ABIY52_06120 [Gemmatimonadaceae bacterium]